MTILDRVIFQKPGSTVCCEATIAWMTNDLQFLLVPTLAEGRVVQLDVEASRQCEDGVFRRIENFTLNKMEKDVLRSLLEMAEAINTH